MVYVPQCGHGLSCSSGGGALNDPTTPIVPSRQAASLCGSKPASNSGCAWFAEILRGEGVTTEGVPTEGHGGSSGSADGSSKGVPVVSGTDQVRSNCSSTARSLSCSRPAADSAPCSTHAILTWASHHAEAPTSDGRATPSANDSRPPGRSACLCLRQM